MSGIYIPGLEMPSNCYYYAFSFLRTCCANGNELTEKDTRPRAEKRPDFCPIVPVSFQGRLRKEDEP